MQNDMDNLAAFSALERQGWSAPGKAAAYHRYFASITRPFVERLLDRLGVGPGLDVLDIGAGPGYVAAAAAARGARAVGADFSAEMVDLAQRLHPDIEFQQADAEHPSLPASSFDVVVANFLLQHLASPERALSAFVELLRPGGRVGVTVWTFPEQSLQWAYQVEASRAAAAAGLGLPPGPDAQALADPDQLRQAVVTAGCRSASVELLSLPYLLSGEEELWQAMTQGSVRGAALVAGLDETAVTALRSGIRRRLAPLRSGEGYAVTLNALVAVGWR